MYQHGGIIESQIQDVAKNIMESKSHFFATFCSFTKKNRFRKMTKISNLNWKTSHQMHFEILRIFLILKSNIQYFCNLNLKLHRMRCFVYFTNSNRIGM